MKLVTLLNKIIGGKFINFRKIIIAILLLSVFVIAIQSTTAATVHTFKIGTAGDITKNSVIKKNIPNSKLVYKVVNAAKKGTPMVKFGNGSGYRVLVVAGVHGNELSSQVAAMNLIKKLEKRKIKGTIYVIPFLIPKTTSLNVRNFKGKEPNAQANVIGSPTNYALRIAKLLKVNALGDFHCTQPEGDPGRTIVLGTLKPTAKSGIMAKAISKLTGFPYRNHLLAGKDYPGALEDAASINRIPAVTCEVKTPHGKIAPGSVFASFKLIIGFLFFNKVL
jgi:predicted deacylase